MARLMASLASDSDEPVGRLNETVEAAESPRWFTDSGAFDGCQLAKYDSGIALPSSLITNILSSALMSSGVARIHLHHHLVLVHRLIDGRDFTLPEGVVQQAVGRLHVNARGGPWFHDRR